MFLMYTALAQVERKLQRYGVASLAVPRTNGVGPDEEQRQACCFIMSTTISRVKTYISSRLNRQRDNIIFHSVWKGLPDGSRWHPGKGLFCILRWGMPLRGLWFGFLPSY